MPEAPTGSSFEADLRALREERGLSVADIERATRVPADVVRRFEDGALMQDPDYSAVYLRAFVKAYAEALDLSTARVNAAFEASRQGTYQGTLAPAGIAPEATDAPTEASQSPNPATALASPPPTRPPTPRSASAPGRPPSGPTGGPTPSGTTSATPMVEALAAQPRPDKPSAPTPPPRRSSAPSSLGSTNQSWGLIVGIAAMSVLALCVVFWLIFREPGPDLEPVASAPVADTTAAPDSAAAAPTPAIPPAPQVGDSVRVTLVAADGPLQNFRMQASPDIRRPYWVEQGGELTFTSPTEVIVWGNETAGGWRVDEGARIRIAGLTYAPANGAVQRLTRARAQAVVDSLHQAQYGE